MPNWVLSFLGLSVILQTTFAYSAFLVNLRAHTQQCFFEILKANERLDLSFQVAEGGHLDIDFWISAPDSKVIHSVYKESTHTFGFSADTPGKHEYCFSNKMSSFAHKQVSFTLMGPDERHHMDEKMKSADPNHEPLAKEIWALADGLSAIKDEQSYMVVREGQHRLTALSTKSRILYWSLFETAILVGVCLFQVTYLKKFFEVRRGI